jgi:hypothetical protein
MGIVAFRKARGVECGRGQSSRPRGLRGAVLDVSPLPFLSVGGQVLEATQDFVGLGAGRDYLAMLQSPRPREFTEQLGGRPQEALGRVGSCGLPGISMNKVRRGHVSNKTKRSLLDAPGAVIMRELSKGRTRREAGTQSHGPLQIEGGSRSAEWRLPLEAI